MEYLFVQYPKCTTCQRAKKWLEDNGVKFTARHIAEQNPTAAELSEWIKISGLSIKKFFNTSGVLYKEMNLKDKLGNMSHDEQIELLASNGMLVKRPLVIGKGMVLVGFRPDEWEKLKSNR